MKVRFEKSVMNDPTAWSVLDLIVQHFLDGRHVWDVDDLENIEQSQWIQTDIDGRAGKRNLEVLYKCYTDSVYPRHGSKMHSITITVTDHGKSDKELTPDDARSCLDMPAYIVVENSESDGAFIEAMIHALGRRELLDSHTEGWWDFEHLGGFGEIGKRIDQIIARTVGPLRIFVLADNDRLYPGQTTKTIQKIEEHCKKSDVPYAILQKRKIENYLPVRLLQKLPRRFKKTCQAFLNLNEEQKNFYEMKKGFKKDNLGHAIVPEEQKTLFENLRQKVLDDLCGGFGDNAWQYFKLGRSEITEQDIRATCPADTYEIDRILDNIESLI